MNILIADYDISYSKKLSTLLQNYGFTVHMAEDLQGAISIIERIELKLAIIDLITENDDSGFVLAYKLKKKNNKLPIIIITSMSSKTGIYFNPDSERERNWLNADAYLTKEVMPEQVIKEVLKMLKM